MDAPFVMGVPLAAAGGSLLYFGIQRCPLCRKRLKGRQMDKEASQPRTFFHCDRCRITWIPGGMESGKDDMGQENDKQQHGMGVARK